MHKVAVYGSLRKGMGNHYTLSGAKYLGRFDTKPIFNLYSLGAFPGLKPKGKSSVVMEVYEVDDEGLKKVDRLEGYNSNSKNNDFYNRVTINTPFGLAYTYLYMRHVDPTDLVESGDWVQYITEEVQLAKILSYAQIF